MKKITIGFVVGSLMVFASTALAITAIFSDVMPTDWFGAAVNNLAHIKVISGYPNGTFRPGNNVTRAEVAVMLDRLKQYVDANYEYFPVTEENTAAKKQVMDFSFHVCQHDVTNERLYHLAWNDSDGKSDETYTQYQRQWTYDRNGKLILARNDVIHDPFPSEIHFKEFNCIPTTRDYFLSKTNFDTRMANLKFCPDSYKKSPSQEDENPWSFKTGEEIRWIEEFDVEWVKQNCPQLNIPDEMHANPEFNLNDA